MSKPPNKETIAYRRRMARENVRAAWLRAKQRQITAKIAVIEAAKERVA